MKIDTVLELGKLWCGYIVYNPEKEKIFFNEMTIPLSILNFVYGELVAKKIISPIENIDAKEKSDLKKMVFDIDKNCSVEKGLRMAKAIHTLGYLSNI